MRLGSVAAVVMTAMFLYPPSPAEACDPAPPFRQQLVDRDLPSCVLLTVSEWTFRPEVIVINECDEDLSFGGPSCSGCQYTTVTSSTTEVIGLNANTDTEDPMEVVLDWDGGGDSGTVVFRITYMEPGTCNYGFGCQASHPPGDRQVPSTLWLIVLALLGLQVRRLSWVRS